MIVNVPSCRLAESVDQPTLTTFFGSSDSGRSTESNDVTLFGNKETNNTLPCL